MSRSAPTLVLGIGNPDRGDDGAGRAVARRLDGRLPADVELVAHGGDAAGLLDVLGRAAAAFVADACITGAQVGTVSRFDVSVTPLPSARFTTSTHGLGLAEALELARTLRRLPPRCVVFAIEGRCFDPGAGLSPAVAGAVEAVARRIRDEVRALAGAQASASSLASPR